MASKKTNTTKKTKTSETKKATGLATKKTVKTVSKPSIEKKNTEGKSNKKKTGVTKPKQKIVKEVAEVELEEDIVLTPKKIEFLNILEEMFKSGKDIGHLLFNGIFRLSMNRRLYEFSDDEIVKAFKTQLGIMNAKRERAVKDETKKDVCRRLLP